MQHGSITTMVQQRSGFRKLLMRISEKIGGTEKTEYTKDFNNMCKELDEYRVNIAQQLISIAQQDPQYVPKPPGKMEFEAPPGVDPFELLEKTLKITINQMESKKQLEQIQNSASKLASLHREYQQKTRRAIHVLEKFRHELDFAKYELKGSKTPETIQVNNALYADALKKFQRQLIDTEDMLKKMPDAREKHRMEIVKCFQLMRKYHQDCASATAILSA
uniref:BAR domain-containing protein n=1 Tax=Setaria digitata TaxID=48799 RepID=A0A915Q7H6_9BILA